MLTGFIKTPCEIIFIGFNRKENSYNKKIINLALDCFKDASKEYPNEIKVYFK